MSRYLDDILTAVRAVPGVESATGWEWQMEVGLTVAGGSDAEVAQAIFDSTPFAWLIDGDVDVVVHAPGFPGGEPLERFSRPQPHHNHHLMRQARLMLEASMGRGDDDGYRLWLDRLLDVTSQLRLEPDWLPDWEVDRFDAEQAIARVQVRRRVLQSNFWLREQSAFGRIYAATSWDHARTLDRRRVAR